MQIRLGFEKRIFRIALVTAAVLVFSPARGAEAEEGSKVPIEVKSAPAGCKNLGEVKGSCNRNPCGPEIARRDALDEARKLGATHLKTTWAGRYGAYTEIYKGVAYRCSATPPVSGQ
ncbi:MAG: hypothetical protein WCS72_19690 [Deltaproteobacteria bacterium]